MFFLNQTMNEKPMFPIIFSIFHHYFTLNVKTLTIVKIIQENKSFEAFEIYLFPVHWQSEFLMLVKLDDVLKFFP